MQALKTGRKLRNDTNPSGSNLGHILRTALPWRRALERWMTATITEVMMRNPAENDRSIGKTKCVICRRAISTA